jgi:hypothetical protein
MPKHCGHCFCQHLTPTAVRTQASAFHGLHALAFLLVLEQALVQFHFCWIDNVIDWQQVAEHMHPMHPFTTTGQTT